MQREHQLFFLFIRKTKMHIDSISQKHRFDAAYALRYGFLFLDLENTEFAGVFHMRAPANLFGETIALSVLHEINRNDVGVFRAKFHLCPDLLRFPKRHLPAHKIKLALYLVIYPIFNFFLFLIRQFMVTKEIYAQALFGNITAPLFDLRADY